jgi:hypothetical protein
MKGSIGRLEEGWIGAKQFLVFFSFSLDTKVNSLDVQLGEFPYRWQASIQQVVNAIQVKARDNRKEGSTEGCGNMESTNTIKAHPILRWASHRG